MLVDDRVWSCLSNDEAGQPLQSVTRSSKFEMSDVVNGNLSILACNILITGIDSNNTLSTTLGHRQGDKIFTFVSEEQAKIDRAQIIDLAMSHGAAIKVMNYGSACFIRGGYRRAKR